MDPFKLLDLNYSASDADIKKAYRDACKKFHPDVTKKDEVAQIKLKILTGHDSFILEID